MKVWAMHSAGLIFENMNSFNIDILHGSHLIRQNKVHLKE